jgi:hypothetical protein
MSHADFFCLPSVQNILLVSSPFTSSVICSVVVILWHNVAEITYKYIAKLYEMHFLFLIILESINVGPCHHGMARPQVADGGTASYVEGSCE